MSTLWQDLRYKTLHSGSKLNLIIGINVLAFLLVSIPSVILFLTGNEGISNLITDYIYLPAYLPKLLTRFWTPLTYMFMHAGVFHILFNMLWLYWMGEIFEEYLGKKRLMGLYLMGGLAGAVFFIASYNLFPVFAGVLPAATVVGASASVMAVVVATATLLPNYTISLMFVGPVKLKWVAAFFVVIDFLGITGGNAGGMIAHLGGALLGFIYIKQLNAGNDWNKTADQLFSQRPKVKVAAKSRPYQSNVTSKPRQEEVDHILDKISQSGYDSLNKHEKETLFRASKHEG